MWEVALYAEAASAGGAIENRDVEHGIFDLATWSSNHVTAFRTDIHIASRLIAISD